MHVGGLVMGLVIGLALFSKKGDDDDDAPALILSAHAPPRRRRGYTGCQACLVALSTVSFAALVVVTVAVALSSELQDTLRACSFCDSINCVEISWFSDEPWWSCCLAQAPGTCGIASNGTVVTATCNYTDTTSFERTCRAADPDCAFDPGDSGAVAGLCARLCARC